MTNFAGANGSMIPMDLRATYHRDRLLGRQPEHDMSEAAEMVASKDDQFCQTQHPISGRWHKVSLRTGRIVEASMEKYEGVMPIDDYLAEVADRDEKAERERIAKDADERLLDNAEGSLIALTQQCAGSCYWRVGGSEDCLCSTAFKSIEVIRARRETEPL